MTTTGDHSAPIQNGEPRVWRFLNWLDDNVARHRVYRLCHLVGTWGDQ